MDDFFSPEPVADSTSDFLKREQAALGNDATNFNSTSSASNDHDFERSASAFPDLDGGDDVFQTSPPGVPSIVIPSSASTLRNEHVSVTGDNEFSAFESQFPEVEVSPVVAPNYQNNGFISNAPVTPSYDQPPNLFAGTPQPRVEESEAIKAWRVKQAGEIAEREAASLKKKEETIVKAQNAIDNFYKEYNSKKEKNIARNKEEEAKFEAARTDALAKGTTWDRICTLVDLQDSRSKSSTTSTQDLGRFREVLLALRKEGESAPGAAGY